MAVIKREAPDQRRHVRNKVPMAVRIQDVSYTVRDCSLEGFGVDDFEGRCEGVGDSFLAEFTVAYRGLDVSFTTKVEVVRLSENDRALGARFVDLTPPEKELLGFALLGSTRNGERAALIEALARIDIPVTPVSAVPTPREAPPPGRTGQLLRRLLLSLFYWAGGLVLGGVILLILYFHFFRLDLGYSVVTLPLYPVISQDVARCKEVFVKEGDTVHAGQPLLRVEDDLLTRNLEVAELQLAAAKVDLDTAANRVTSEKEKLALYKDISEKKLEAARAQVASLVEQVKQANSTVNRLKRLVANRAASYQDLELAAGRLSLLGGQLNQARVEQQIAENALYALKHGAFYDQRKLVGDLPQFLVNLDDAKQRRDLAGKRLEQTKERAGRLAYNAPFDGRVAKVLKVVDSTMNRGEAVMVLEKAGGEPVIDGFVTQDEANNLTVGAKASLWVPALDRTFHGQVVKIDRTSGFLTEMQAHLKDSQLRYNWRGDQDHSAYVQLVITDELTPEVKGRLVGGMPVTASVARRPALWQKLCALVGQ